MHSIVWHLFLKCREGVYEKATGAREFFYWAYSIVVICGHHQKDSGETILIGLENSFRSIKLKYHPIGVSRISTIQHSALRVLKLRAQNPAGTSWAAVH